MSDLPNPFVETEVDIMDFAFTPIFRARLFGSSFHARVSDSEWRAGVTLWLKSWDQVPAGSLPDDDIDLCRLAELGRDIKSWRKIRVGALHGWVKCTDGRLYHAVVAEGVNEAWTRKLEQRWRSECARIKKYNQRHKTEHPAPSLEEYLSRAKSAPVPEDNASLSPGTGSICPEDVPEEMESKGQGQGQGEQKDTDAAPEWIAVGYRVMDMMEVRDDPRWFGNASPAKTWLEWGADPEVDIYPTVEVVLRRHLTKGRGPPKSLNFFDNAISDAIALRQRPRPEAQNVSSSSRQKPGKPTQESDRRELLEAFGLSAGNDGMGGDAGPEGPILDGEYRRSH